MKRREFNQWCAASLAWGSSAGVHAAAQERDQVVLAEARQRIEQHRRGDVSIVVRRPDGKALEDAALSLTQKRHDFLFGCNIFRWGRIPDLKREEAYRERFAALFNYATLPFYWAGYERERGKPMLEYTDRVIAWCQDQGITCKGHPLAWDDPYSSPAWLPKEPAEVERLSTARVHDIVKRFAGRIDIWDVVNEPTDMTRSPTRMNGWARQRGAIPYTILHLKTARAAHRKATLLVNDYRTDPAYLQILQELKAKEAPFDGVGIQSHMHSGPWSSARTEEVCDRFATLKLPLQFTETTLVSGPKQGDRWGETTSEGEERQAVETARFYTVLFSHPAVQAITWWDFSDDGAWQGAPAGWLRKDMSRKPAYERLLHLIRKQWWTHSRGVTGPHGEWSARAFFGDYDLAIRLPNGSTVRRTLEVRRGSPNRFEVALG